MCFNVQILFGQIFRLYRQYMECILINICLLFALYSDEKIIFPLYVYYTDNMHMVFRLFATLFTTSLASWSHGRTMLRLRFLDRGWCCPGFLLIHLSLQPLLFPLTSLLFNCLLGLVLFLFIIFFGSSHLWVVFSWKKKEREMLKHLMHNIMTFENNDKCDRLKNLTCKQALF